MILALDFDGVLHPRVTQREPLFCRVELLERWLRAHEGVNVVISSSWREFHSLDEMRAHFSEDIRERIVGATPLARLLFKEMGTPEEAQDVPERQLEIEAWCTSRGLHKESWIALDDDARLFEPACSRLVLCDPKVGIRPGTLFRLTRMLEASHQP